MSEAFAQLGVWIGGSKKKRVYVCMCGFFDTFPTAHASRGRSFWRDLVSGLFFDCF